MEPRLGGRLPSFTQKPVNRGKGLERRAEPCTKRL